MGRSKPSSCAISSGRARPPMLPKRYRVGYHRAEERRVTPCSNFADAQNKTAEPVAGARWDRSETPHPLEGFGQSNGGSQPSKLRGLSICIFLPTA
jgi:hypothetical protein